MFRAGVVERVCETPTTLSHFVENVLESLSPRPSLTAFELLQMGSVYVDDERCLNGERLLNRGSHVRVHSTPRRFRTFHALSVISENASEVVVKKPAGLPVAAVVDNLTENLLSFLESQRGQAFYFVHTLETEESGVVLVAKSSERADELKQAFQNSQVSRDYILLTEKTVAEGNYVIKSIEEENAPTNLLTIGDRSWSLRDSTISHLYRVHLRTTLRPQALRQAFAELGHPIIGDSKNGSTRAIRETDTDRAGFALVVTGLFAPGAGETVA